MPSFNFAELTVAGSRFTVDRAVIALLWAIASPGEISAAKAAIEALKPLPDKDRRVVLFGSNAHSDKLGNFQIAACGVSSGGTVVMKIGMFYFTALESDGWLVKDHEGFVQHRARAFPYRADSPALAALGGISDEPALGLASAVLRELDGLASDDRTRTCTGRCGTASPPSWGPGGGADRPGGRGAGLTGVPGIR